MILLHLTQFESSLTRNLYVTTANVEKLRKLCIPTYLPTYQK